MEELRKRVAAAEEAAKNATEEVDEFNSDRQDKELALSEFDIRKAVVEPRLNDLGKSSLQDHPTRFKINFRW